MPQTFTSEEVGLRLAEEGGCQSCSGKERKRGRAENGRTDETVCRSAVSTALLQCLGSRGRAQLA